MIDEKKKEEAADAYLLEKLKNNVIGDSDFKDVPNAFIAGINWLLDNLWHDASEEPKKDELVLTDTRSIANKEHICWQAVKLSDNGFIRNWSNYVKATKITRWLYIEDLMKGGK